MRLPFSRKPAYKPLPSIGEENAKVLWNVFFTGLVVAAVLCDIDRAEKKLRDTCGRAKQAFRSMLCCG